MRIINVIQMDSGVIQDIKSFCVYEEADSQSVVDSAEAYFLELVEANLPEGSIYDSEQCLDNGYFEGLSGYEVHLVWSCEV